MTINRVLPSQIPVFWEVIKLAQRKVNRAKAETFNHLLYKLLNSKAQCFRRLNEKKELMCIYLTEIYIEENTGTKIISVDAAYGMEAMTDEMWQENTEHIVKFGKSAGCTKMYGLIDIRNKRMLEVCKKVGMQSVSIRVARDI